MILTMSEIERRREPRSQVAMACTLIRRIGNPIAATTVDVGSGGMSVTTRRPLAVDEMLSFELPRMSGRACVLRSHGGDVYGLRFEGELVDLSARARQSPPAPRRAPSA